LNFVLPSDYESYSTLARPPASGILLAGANHVSKP